MISSEGILALVAIVSTVSRGTLGSDEHRQISRVRGISLQMKAFYDPLKDFQCLDGSMRLPFSYVNDDYCDCPDGSDEPGTSACPRGKFHCVNLMHSPLDIPSSRVNDGLCDCCDGSDEYDSGVSCPNTCDELGRAAREEAKRREELISQGGKLRRALVDDGKQKVNEAKQKIDELKTEVEKAKATKDERDALRKEAEEKERVLLDEEAKSRREAEDQNKAQDEQDKERVNKYVEEDKLQAEEAFHDLDTNEDGLVTYSEVMNYLQFDQNKDGTVSEDEAKFFLAYREEVDSEEFSGTAWPLIKPAWLLHKTAPFQDPSEAEGGAGAEADGEADGETETHDGENPPQDEDYEEVDEPEAPSPAASADAERDPAVKAAVEAADRARLAYHDAERKHKEIEQELEKFEQIVSGDFGEESEFVPLRGECFEFAEKEYIYKMCPFDKSSQRSKDGGSETSLGRWVRWEQRDGNRYAAMKFEGGTGCWNGPSRSTVVLLQCGLSNQLVSATEPSRCEYQFEFATPAACVAGMPIAPQGSGAASGTEHDEL
ncbi:glucosidase 2 subunit beta [Galendromus occidentalis]|uniref:Glucosidase 2 subunit beta n=1 Tax=Galendromus occidentalis TaxID=34638 RepID=A0AAJ6VWE4_9ACAR|nr:glucosidase 2 subunit beta [Galendromus occidentalis]